ncbi:hypothetical protein [Cohnella sp. 56]|uniref:hypothetical protein n=1 Tax=Cohnella sp. 56 TaxID=3113722 RepID=UPI0030E7BF8F
MNGWIKLHRNMLDNPAVCKDAEHLAVWVFLLLNATHKPYDTMIGGKRVTLQPGQLVTSRVTLSDELDISQSKVERIINLFKIEQQIEQQTFSKNRVISILNWHKYQESEHQNEQEVDTNRTPSEHQPDTNKNKRIKELKNTRTEEQKNLLFAAYTSNPDLISCLDSFSELRKKIKKPLTDRAITLLLGKLDELATGDVDKIAILEQSILNSWQGIFPLKGETGNAQPRGRPPRGSGEYDLLSL